MDDRMNIRQLLPRLLNPRSVAIVGASPTPGSLGASVLKNLRRANYSGELHLVNPKRDTIDGLPCLKSVDELPLGVDVAVLAIPQAGVLPSLEGLVKREIGAVVIFSSGFAESGEAGRKLQNEIARLAIDNQVLIEGPNCLGMINGVAAIPLTFVELPFAKLGNRRGVGLVSQSGAMAAVLGVSLLSRDIGMAYSISTGNEAVTGVEDFVDYLIDDPHTQVIAMIVEQFRRPLEFLRSASRARIAGKLIVLLHPGASAAARASAETHTGAMAGDYEVMKMKVREAGVIVVESLEELGDVTEIAYRCETLPNGNAAVITESGAFKALTLDLCESIGLKLPKIAEKTRERLRAAMPDFIPVSNPLDLTAQALIDPDLYRRTLEALASDAHFGSIVFGIIQTDESTSALKFPPIIDAVSSIKPTSPIVVAGLDEGASVPADYVRQLRGLGVPYFPTAERAFRAIARLQNIEHRSSRFRTISPITIQGVRELSGIVPEYRSKELISVAGISFPKRSMVQSVDGALQAADQLGYPVVLKAQSAQLSHKSDSGGVVIGINDSDRLRTSWHAMHERIAKHHPDLKLDGILVESMCRTGLEMIIGARRVPNWGPILMVGFGGILAELLNDFRLLSVDLTRDAILAELEKLKGKSLLDGLRGSKPCDKDAIVDIIETLGRIMVGEPSIAEIDLNPVVVYGVGDGAMALDALISVEAH